MKLWWCDTNQEGWDVFEGCLVAALTLERAEELARERTNQHVNDTEYLGVAAPAISDEGVLHDSFHAG